MYDVSTIFAITLFKIETLKTQKDQRHVKLFDERLSWAILKSYDRKKNDFLRIN